MLFLYFALIETATRHAVKSSIKSKRNSIETNDIFLRKTLGRKLRHGFLRA